MDRGTTSTNTLGAYYGWDTGVTDGRYVYYAPGTETYAPQHGGTSNGNWVRYDSTIPFSSTNAWSHFDFATINNSQCVSASSTCSLGFQGSAYDGHRYVYLPDQVKNNSVRYDTWGGGASLNGGGFTYATNYVQLDVTQLGTGNYPPVTGIGNIAIANSWTGAVIAWDRENLNQYLYFIPFGLGTIGTLSSITVRCKVGQMVGGSWQPVDFTSVSTSTGPAWEIMDLSTFTLNQAWNPAWPTVFQSGTFAGYSQIGGFQLGWWDPGRNLVTFNADVSAYSVQHDVNHHLYDPTGWFIGPTGSPYPQGSMGGGFNPATNIFYPSLPLASLLQYQGLAANGLSPATNLTGVFSGTCQ